MLRLDLAGGRAGDVAGAFAPAEMRNRTIMQERPWIVGRAVATGVNDESHGRIERLEPQSWKRGPTTC